ncbi:Stp1/IreP family PP2C-type Ser/Thr phosphatase [Pseudenhygromyxa sp. WMMC2535]|uniref:Stp1/IreP family PP2C-type Ser/Thr phosphatase n=1 Tax=Pseudenhygromyxa sp. WMMC2535 TaxID=2712867 RepID=UPI001551EAE9|nr:Stp1/IreP family PP2C-type Ser/Thr phosphatase [Pseudenhygromyxa sp. WMMC2535]
MSISFAVGRERVRFAGRTDVGRVRDHNEDNLLIPDEFPIAVVSDGMGGHASGEVASKITVDVIGNFYKRTGLEKARTWPFRVPQLEIEKNRMITAIKLANSEIFETAAADDAKKGMGCTVESIFFDQGRFYIGHVGDSRVYRVRDGALQQLTEDHSLLNDWKRMKDMSGDEIRNFPHRNVVVRALGLSERVYVDVIVEEYKVDDIYLLCSDGLNDMLDDAQILEIIEKRKKRLDGACEALVDAANEAGGKDNITALLAHVLES